MLPRAIILRRLLFLVCLACAAPLAANEGGSAVTVFDSASQMAAVTERRAELERSLHSLSSTQAMLGRYAFEPTEDVVRAVEAFSEGAAAAFANLEQALAAARELHSAVSDAHTQLATYVESANAPARAAEARLPNLERDCTAAEQAVIRTLAEHGENAPQTHAAWAAAQRACDEYDATFEDAGTLFDPMLVEQVNALRNESASLIGALEHEMTYAGRNLERARRRIDLVITEDAVRDAVDAMQVDSDTLRSALRDTSARIRGLVDGLGSLPELGPRLQQMPTRPQRARSLREFVEQRGGL